MSDFEFWGTIALVVLMLILSGFFSSSETGLMTLNRYRLRHLARDKKNRGAVLAERLLKQPDRLIGLILLGNNLVNIFAAILVGKLAEAYFGDAGAFIGGLLLTVVVLIFSETMPKTFAALRPERIAFPAAYVYTVLIKPFAPIVWAINKITNGILALFGVRPEEGDLQPLTREELRTVLTEAGSSNAEREQTMMLGIMDLDHATVEDIMIPRGEIYGIDIDQPWEDVRRELLSTEHTRLPIYQESIDDVIGILHTRNALKLLGEGKLDAKSLLTAARAPYFVPEATPLAKQLREFQSLRRRIGLVVDEYGDILGLITLEDILEEVVGDFTTDPSAEKGIFAQHDGSHLVRGSVGIRALNRSLNLNLPSDGPKTLSGILVETLEMIPEPGMSAKVHGYPMEILEVEKNRVGLVRIYQPVQKNTSDA